VSPGHDLRLCVLGISYVCEDYEGTYGTSIDLLDERGSSMAHQRASWWLGRLYVTIGDRMYLVAAMPYFSDLSLTCRESSDGADQMYTCPSVVIMYEYSMQVRYGIVVNRMS